MNTDEFLKSLRQKTWAKYGFAFLMFLFALGIRMALLPLIGINAPFFTFDIAILLTSYLLGMGPGILIVVLSAPLAAFLFEEPYHHGIYEGIFVGTAFFLQGVLFSWLPAKMVISLREKDDQLKLLISNTPDHIIIQDLDLRYELVVNPQLGLTLADMLGKTDFDFLSREDAESLTLIKKGILDSAKSLHIEIPLKSKSGEIEYFDGSYIPRFNSRGRVSGVIGYFRNVTDRKRAEKALLLKQEADSANRAKDQFLAILSHELRTPLTSIMMWTQMIKAGKVPPEKTQNGIHSIEESGKALNRLIDDLLDVSTITSGKFKIKLEVLEPKTVLLSAIEMIRPSAEKRSITVQEEFSGLDLRVSADPMRLKQVFSNLLSNAIKFTPSGGRVKVILEPFDDGTGKKLRVKIQDSGMGIAQEFLPLLFVRFFQLDSSPNRPQGGLGLGLWLVRNLIEMQGGTVEAFSEGAGKGSTFTVSLPLV